VSLRLAFACAVLFHLSTGCRSDAGRPVAIRIIDAETKAAVPGAEVRIWRPRDREAITSGPPVRSGSDGIVRIQSTATPDSPSCLEVRAAGYQSDEIDVGVGTEQVIELYAGPRPTVEFQLPTGFRGSLSARLKVVDAAGQPGQRVFIVPVGPADSVDVTGPAVLKHGSGPTFKARLADGTELPQQPTPDQVALRWLKVDGDTHQFIVGTHADWEAAQGPTRGEPGARPSKGMGGGKGGGGGRGHGGRGGGGGKM
jgi:hypothetical protein